MTMQAVNAADCTEPEARPNSLRARVKRLPGVGLARRALDAMTGARAEQWIRVEMNRACLELVESLGPGNLDALEVSGDLWRGRCAFRSYRSAEYPAYDVCAGPLEERFDLILADQVFEHLLWPYRAARNVHAMLRPGGYALVSTPFMLRVHPCPVDCGRWTETGLKHLLAEGGFALEDIRTASWGNRAAVRGNLNRWPRYRPLLHSLRNEPAFPIVVWALARRGA
ncbi:MAG TPA: methyltransferase domain-containing protein [Phycisphaerales bacterium]|nr:methyltransferase domain-containing protein [Phycisphaerales bacterium]